MTEIPNPSDAPEYLLRIEVSHHLRAAADLAEHGEARYVIEHIEEAERLSKFLTPDRKRQS